MPRSIQKTITFRQLAKNWAVPEGGSYFHYALRLLQRLGKVAATCGLSIGVVVGFVEARKVAATLNVAAT